MTRFRVLALGVRLDLHVEDVALAAVLGDLLVDVVDGDRRGPADALVLVLGTGGWTIVSPGHLAEAGSREAAVSAALAAVNLTAVHSTRLLALHAAVLARQDRVLVVPAASGAGKSTLAACLLQRGWSYVSDEALCLRWDTGSVVPYPRPMSLSEWSASTASVRGVAGHDGTAAELLVSATGAGWSRAGDVGPPTDVLLLSRREGPPSLEPVVRQDVVVELLRRSFTHFLDPARSLQLVSTVVTDARCRRLHLGDPRAAAALLDGPDAPEARPSRDAPLVG